MPSSFATCLRLDVFEGDVHSGPKGRVGGVPPKAFVWSVSDDGTVALREMYDSVSKPKNWIMPVEDLKKHWRRVSQNDVLRRQAAQAR